MIQLFHNLEETCKYYKVDNTGKILETRAIKIKNLQFDDRGELNLCYTFDDYDCFDNKAFIDVINVKYGTYITGIFTSEEKARNAGFVLKREELEFKIMRTQFEIDELIQQKQKFQAELDELNNK